MSYDCYIHSNTHSKYIGPYMVNAHDVYTLLFFSEQKLTGMYLSYQLYMQQISMQNVNVNF